MADNRTCLCCGTKYEYCTRCSKHSSEPKWKFLFDSEECKEVFNAVSGYNMGVQTEQNVLDVIGKYNITDNSKFKKSIADVLSKVNESNAIQQAEINNKARKAKNKKQDEIVDVELKEEEIISEEVASDETLI